MKATQSLCNFHYLSILICVVITFGACSSHESVPTQMPVKTLPHTWTPVPTIEVTETPTITPTPTPTATSEPDENWWAVSLEINQNLRVNFARETKDGGIFLWAQDSNHSDNVTKDLLIKLQKNGIPAWVKSISPGNARGQFIQELHDGNFVLYGFHQEMDFPHPFYIHFSENGDVISSVIYQGITERTDQYYLYLPTETNQSYSGKVKIKGELPGSHYVSEYRHHPDGSMTVIGPIHGPITSDGATFSYLRGLWAIRFDEENQIVWQRFFQTKPTGPFFEGLILSNGSILVTQDQNEYLSILKMDPDGYTTFWKHYSSILSVQSLSGSNDGSSIIAARRTQLIKLDPRGDILWSKELELVNDQQWIQYALETGDGDIILVLGSGQNRTIVSRLSIEELVGECPDIKFTDNPLFEHFPFPAYNISGTVRVTPYPIEMADWMTHISLEDNPIIADEICRYRD